MIRRRFEVGFDSSAAMAHALGLCLHGRPFAGVGLAPQAVARRLGRGGAVVNAVPERGRSWIFAALGWREAVSPAQLGDLHSDVVAARFVDRYPRRRGGMVAVGSSNGAVVHLCAAAAAPWLPQTFLVGLRTSGVPLDHPEAAMKRAASLAEPLLRRNPDLVLHHMHDPNQDALMLRRMSYFRLKWRRLPDAYRRFLGEVLAPGGTILVVDCGRQWPVTHVQTRHVFQHGAVGGLEADDYRARWDGPAPDGDAPEAEWGFDAELMDDLDAVAAKHRLRLVRMKFNEPEDMSGLVADLYRWWYANEGVSADRLLAESCILLDPWTVIRRGWVPLWLVFPVEASAARLESYLRDRDLRHVRILLFAHGARSAGVALPQRWRDASASVADADLLAVDERAFPADFGVYLRYAPALERLPGIGPRAPLSVVQLEQFARDHAGAHRVAWT